MMNERILELADKAIEDMPGAWNIPDEFCKKFAQLIVAECAMFVVTELEGKVGSRIADATANRLEEHFGVE